MGISRVLEALQANDWSQAEFDDEEEADDAGGGESSHVRALKGGADQGKGDDGAGDNDDDDNDEFDPESLDFGFDREDFAGLRKAIWSAQRRDDDDDEFMDRTGMAPKGKAQDDRGEDGDEALGEDDVQKLEGMMQKLLAVRDMSAGLPEGQRKRMAKQAVTEVMKDL